MTVRPAAFEKIKPLLAYLNLADQMTTELSAMCIVASTVAQIAEELTGKKEAGFSATLGVTIGASRAIIDGLKVIPRAAENLVHGLPGATIVAIGTLWPQMVPLISVFYASKLLGIIAASGAKVALNRAGWNENVASTTIFLSGLLVAMSVSPFNRT